MLMRPPPPNSTLFPYTTLFRSQVSTADANSPTGSAIKRFVDARISIDPDDVNGIGEPHTFTVRSEEHTSELQSRLHLVCRLLLEKKKHNIHLHSPSARAPPPPT